jgi:O-antigen/teichoic acid export membrane protein
MVREMGSFAGWTFLGTGAYMLNAQGINLLFNIFFGVRVNAARDVTAKLDGNMTRFIGNITTAINPQINKSYASGNLHYMHELICKGARYSYLLYFFFAFPIILEAPELLRLWLGVVPEHAAAFVRIAMLASLFTAMGAPFAHAIFATGKVKIYEIVASATTVLAFPCAWIAFRLGGKPEVAYWMLAAITFAVFVERIAFAHAQTGLSVRKVLSDAVAGSALASIAAAVVPLLLFFLMEPGTVRTIWVVLSSFASTAVAAFLLGTTKGERDAIISSVKNHFHQA